VTEGQRDGAHPDSEQLAAFFEGRLGGAERTWIEAHLADCDDCREWLAGVVQLARDYAAAMPQTTRTSLSMRWIPTLGRRGAVVGGVLAMAASLVFVVRVAPTWNPFRQPTPVEQLADALGTRRITEGRLTGGFEYGPVPSPARGPDATPGGAADYNLLALASQVQSRAAAEETAENVHALGIAHLAMGRYDDAVTAFERALTLGASPARRSDLAAAYLTRGTNRDRPEDLPKALALAEQAIRADGDLQEAYFNRALALESLHLPGAAIDAWEAYVRKDPGSAWADEARRHLARLRGGSSAGLSTGDTLVQVFDSGSAAAVMSAARAEPQRARTWLEDEGLPGWAHAFARRDRSAAARLERLDWIARALYARQGDSLAQEAVQAVRDAVRAGETSRATELSRGHLAFRDLRSAYARNDMRLVAALALKCARHLEVGGSPFVAWARHYLVVTSYYEGQLEDAERRLRDLRDEPSLAGYPLLTARLSWDAGTLRFARGDFDAALAAYDDAHVRYTQSGEAENAAAVEQLSGECLARIGQAAASWRRHFSTLGVLGAVADRRRRHTILMAAGFWCMAQDIPDAAAYFFTDAGRNARAWNVPDAITETYLNRAQAYFRSGLLAAAHADLARADTALAEVADAGLHAKFGGDLLAAKAELNERTNPAAAVSLATGAFAEYGRLSSEYRLASLHLSRARAYLRLGRADEAERDFLDGLDLLESKRALVQRRELRVSFADPVWDLYAGLASLYVSSDRTDAGLQVLERARARDILEGFTNDGPPVSRAVGLQVPPATIVLCYLVADDDVYAWSLTPAGRQFRRLPVGADLLRREVDDFLRAIVSDANAASISRLGTLLADQLLVPFGPGLDGAEHVAIVADGPLHDLPFAALRYGGRFLVESHAVAVAPSVSVMNQASARLRSQPPLPDSAAVLAVSRGDSPERPHLPAVSAEALAVASAYGRAAVLLDGEATAAAFRSAVQEYDVVHFAGHAVANAAYPWMSRLILGGGRQSPEEFLRSLDPADVRARLVVLGACETGVGLNTRGEGPLSLARPFLAAGIPNVVASLWAVQDAPSRELLLELHRRHAQGDSVPTALRRAQLHMLSHPDAGWRSPRHWVGFVALGAVQGTKSEAP
jgi:CHAT domain-containing protein